MKLALRLTSLLRSVFAMGSRHKPSQPLVVVLGSTGTGKSDLAVELATRFRGEIINTDAMQMYRGLPILTNKITPEERRSIPHHLIDHIPLDREPWVVGDFKREASRVIREIRSRGNLPVLVGGTHYYVDGLLFDRLVDQGEKESDEADGHEFPELDEPTEALMRRLREVDPTMADRWHPNDRRKIRRSLEIYLRTGKRASEYYAEQAAMEPVKKSNDPWETLLFWVHSDREVLTQRLDARVDKMLSAGLMDEVRDLDNYIKKEREAGKDVDLTRGVWQSIGYKEFQPYLEAESNPSTDPDRTEALRQSGIEDVKTATRRYAKYQTRWIRHKMIPLLKKEHERAFDHLYVVDSTDVSRWSEKVVGPAEAITTQFLTGDKLPNPREMSETARRVLLDAENITDSVPCRKVCDVCEATFLFEHKWQEHIRSRAHRNRLRKRQRLALVPVADANDGQKAEEAAGSGSHASSDLDTSLIDAS